MKKTLALLLLIPLALICSCQKRDATAEQQLTQRKSELDAREKALDEREKALAERTKLVARPRVAPIRRAPASQHERRIPSDLQGLVPDTNQGTSEREQRMQERLAERQRKTEEVQRMRVPAVSPQATIPPTDEADSPSPSPTPE